MPVDGDPRRTCWPAAASPSTGRSSIAFIHFDGTDELIEQRRARRRSPTTSHELVAVVQAACDEHGVCFLATDVDDDGGKLILTAGAPTITGDDEERMLLALREIVDAERAIPIRIGVNRGRGVRRRHRPVVPPHVHGDGRRREPLRAADGEGRPRARSSRRPRSSTARGTRFETTELEPFMVKGKAKPVQALGGRRRDRVADPDASVQLPLIGRDEELGELRGALADARGRARAARRAHRRAGDRQVSADRGASRRSGGGFLLARPRRSRLPARTSCGVRSSARCWGGLGGRRRDGAPASDGRDRDERRALAPWLPLIAIPARRRRADDAGGRTTGG